MGGSGRSAAFGGGRGIAPHTRHTSKAAYCPKEIILAAINDCYNIEHGEASQMLATMTRGDERGEGDVEVYDLLDSNQHQAPIIKFINLILTEAIQQGSSDIHFEPYENGFASVTASMVYYKTATAPLQTSRLSC